MPNSLATPLTKAFDGGAWPLHCRIRSVTSIFSFSARSGNVRIFVAQAAPMCVENV